MNYVRYGSMLSLSLLLALSALSVSAQTGSSVRIKVSPEVPGPDTPVTIELQDTSSSLADTLITWELDGKEVLSGVGRHSFSFTTGSVGEERFVSVRAEKGGEALFERDFVFRPGVVTLAWEADTYAPPFYKGKTLASPGADIRVFAMTDIRDAFGKPMGEGDLMFLWERDGTKLADRSGIGRSSFLFTGNQLLNGERITVVVRRRDGEVVGKGSIFIPYIDPVIYFYERNPLRGILYETRLPSQVTVGGEEFTLVAEPYFASARTRSDGSLSYAWNVGGSPVEGARGLVTLRSEGGEGGATVSLSMQHVLRSRLLQAADASLDVLFSGTRPLFNF